MSQLKQLRWQCRRGTKELDALLCAYLDDSYSGADKDEQKQFSALLKQEDNQLLAYFFAHKIPNELELKAIVEKIRVSTIR